MNNIISGVVTIAVAIVGLATLAVLVSKNANTSGVIGAAGQAFSGSIGAAVGPVSGGGFGNINSTFGGYNTGFPA